MSSHRVSLLLVLNASYIAVVKSC